MANTRVTFCGVDFKNPLAAASAEPTLNAANMKKCIDAGAGAVIAKTMTDSPAMRELTQRAKWRFLNDRHEVCHGKVPRSFSLYSRSGLALEQPEDFMKEIRETVDYAAQNDAVVIGSVASTDIDGWVTLGKQMEDGGVPLIELNFGCPHPKLMPGVRTGMNVGQDFDYGCEITQKVADALSVPVIVKVTPQVTDLVLFSDMLHKAGAKAVTLTNRFIGFVPDIETGKPQIYGKAGVGGPWTKPLTLRWINEVRTALGDKLDITGTNGAYDWRDIVMFIMSGAHIVQMCSAVMCYGYEWLEKQVRGLEEFMDRKGYETIDQMLGIATDSCMEYADMPHEKATVDSELCKNCGMCLKACFSEAMQQGDETVYVREENCVGCGGCYSVCPVKKTITMVRA
ncbi:4Fe-4S dicluster-binding protein [Desulforhopalus singaporensis]|uniref:dihydrouracil dehydrogenase (NAD(+)) n=1 Tax=Desulforhopalus singaporensis TaxID=91360 RepID=A0A1H0RSS9_9BACT|nr:4Fe-4S dicluster-binding protein [Desulforhopalus singaporensis]SDP32409.1 dihydropyrimidine dehydrogenase (NAD+) subunit PreA [Desulforhopalus singaporensis]